MQFRIADTFTDSLARLTGQEQSAVKTTAFDLQLNPANPGLKFHKLDKVRDKNFWSVRVNSDIRLIVHKTADSMLLCYVDHHDKAYDWAERRRLETHPKTGAAQLVEIRETIQEIIVPIYVEAQAPVRQTPPLFAHLSEDELLSYGVPKEWIDDVHKATEDSILTLADHLPAEAAEALLELAVGGQPRVRTQPATIAPFEHPDAQRRFRIVSNLDELERALNFPWEKWTTFLHPDQRAWVERDYNGPARVSGSAGTGKTVVALHRAVHLARKNPDSRILLTTHTDTLSNALHGKLKRLIGNEPRLADRIDVHSLQSLGLRLYKAQIGEINLATRLQILAMLKAASKETPGQKFATPFLLSEWEHIVDAWQLDSWEAYRKVPRLGRKTRLQESQRAILWSIFEKVRTALSNENLKTQAAMFTATANAVGKASQPPFDFAVVDESQDLGIPELKFFAALGGNRPNSLFFAGDLGQRIFQQPFSWKAIGVDIRGRSRTLKVNYRTSHQIRMQADQLLGPESRDIDENVEQRNETISVFNGPPPAIKVLKSFGEEASHIADWITALTKSGYQPHEFGIFVRSEGQLDRAKSAASKAQLPLKVLDEKVETTAGFASISTMHLAKGLEFRAVAVMACDDDVIPLQERIESIGDDSDLQEVYETERHLLYVACTRARDQLLVTGVQPASEFLDDLSS